jgi:hypothetical protein
MKYEAKQSAQTQLAASTPDGTPWTSIAWSDAKAACASAGAHLITNDEWMTIARNVEATDAAAAANAGAATAGAERREDRRRSTPQPRRERTLARQPPALSAENARWRCSRARAHTEHPRPAAAQSTYSAPPPPAPQPRQSTCRTSRRDVRRRRRNPRRASERASLSPSRPRDEGFEP